MPIRRPLKSGQAKPSPAKPGPGKPSEDGYILIGVIFLLVLFVIAMAVAAPKIAADIQRDREVETMHRGKQYIRGIQLYYRKFHAYPPNLDALVKSNEIRFVRKKYLDPTTGKDDWKPVMMGQNKTPMAMGFFGQPLGGAGGTGATPIAGTGPSGGGTGLGSSSFGGTPLDGSNGIGGGSSFNGGVGSTNSGGMFNNPTNTPGSTTGSTDPTTGTPGSGTAGSGPSVDANGNPIAGTTGGTTGGIAGQTFGGAGIIGVTPASPKQSILVYKKKNHYNEWEFLYSPLSEMQTISGGGGTGTLNGQPAGGVGNTNTGPGTNGGFGPGGNTGSTPLQPTPAPPPTQPQQ